MTCFWVMTLAMSVFGVLSSPTRDFSPYSLHADTRARWKDRLEPYYYPRTSRALMSPSTTHKLSNKKESPRLRMWEIEEVDEGDDAMEIPFMPIPPMFPGYPSPGYFVIDIPSNRNVGKKKKGQKPKAKAKNSKKTTTEKIPDIPKPSDYHETPSYNPPKLPENMTYKPPSESRRQTLFYSAGEQAYFETPEKTKKQTKTQVPTLIPQQGIKQVPPQVPQKEPPPILPLQPSPSPSRVPPNPPPHGSPHGHRHSQKISVTPYEQGSSHDTHQNVPLQPSQWPHRESYSQSNENPMSMGHSHTYHETHQHHLPQRNDPHVQYHETSQIGSKRHIHSARHFRLDTSKPTIRTTTTKPKVASVPNAPPKIPISDTSPKILAKPRFDFDDSHKSTVPTSAVTSTLSPTSSTPVVIPPHSTTTIPVTQATNASPSSTASHVTVGTVSDQVASVVAEAVVTAVRQAAGANAANEFVARSNPAPDAATKVPELMESTPMSSK